MGLKLTEHVRHNSPSDSVTFWDGLP